MNFLTFNYSYFSVSVLCLYCMYCFIVNEEFVQIDAVSKNLDEFSCEQ